MFIFRRSTPGPAWERLTASATITPTFFTLTSGSLIYNVAQNSYVRSAGAGLEAAQHSLEDVREVVAEDAALTFVALDRDQQREAVLEPGARIRHQSLSRIVQDRFNAGLDSKMNLLDAQLSVAQPEAKPAASPQRHRERSDAPGPAHGGTPKLAASRRRFS